MGELYAEVRGNGPVLVLVPGGGGDAGVYGAVAPLVERELPAFCLDYVVDLEALCRSPVPWVVATGADSTGRPYARSARVLAERTGVDCVRFPGGHTVYQDAPSVFAERLVGLVKELEQCREQD